MKIDGMRIRNLKGTIEVEGVYMEERLVRPLDVYEEFRTAPWEYGNAQIDDRHFGLSQLFLEISTDDGITGIAGPIWTAPAMLILSQLKPLLIGRDPLASEFLWDLMHRAQVHGRQGETMLALSSVDLALWDIKGKAFGQPVWRLLGGPNRTMIPTYASMLGYAVEDLGLVRERALMVKQQGFKAQKWFFRHGPMSGHEGLKKNVGLVRTLREAVGDDHDIMLDCWQSMNYEYAVDLCARIEEYRPLWIEEPFMPDRIDTHVKLKAKTRIPIAGAEHDYTRWGMKRFVEKDALDVIQADPCWCGGMSELLKIGAYVTTHDLTLIPHGFMSTANIHFSAVQSPIHTPYQECLLKWHKQNMHFMQERLPLQGGSLPLPSVPGMAMEINSDWIESEAEFNL